LHTFKAWKRHDIRDEEEDNPMKIDVLCKLAEFRRFMIISTCQSFIPLDLLRDEMVFPERQSTQGTMYVEAEDKVTLKRVEPITFVRVSEVLGIIYTSKSGRTQLKWRNVREDVGRLTGDASTNSLVNLFTSQILDESYVAKVKEGAR
jgi:hypothetical protein